MRGRTAHLFLEGVAMPDEADGKKINVELRPLIGLLADVPEPIVEHLTVQAMTTHRELVQKAEALFEALPSNERSGAAASSTANFAYLQATIEMHAQMSALTTLLTILGRTPRV
jgi:hypothetical protein